MEESFGYFELLYVIFLTWYVNDNLKKLKSRVSIIYGS